MPGQNDVPHYYFHVYYLRQGWKPLKLLQTSHQAGCQSTQIIPRHVMKFDFNAPYFVIVWMLIEMNADQVTAQCRLHQPGALWIKR